MQADLVEFLQTDDAEVACANLMGGDLSESRTLDVLDDLRRRFPADQAGALLTLARLRVRAKNKFPQAEHMFFTGEALEQATAWPVALHRAERMVNAAPPGDLLDLGCGIGGDTLALARNRRVIAYEQDPQRLALAQANARALGLTERIDFHLADWVAEMAAGRLPRAAGVFVDPGRRSEGRRIFHTEELAPPLSTILRLEKQTETLAVKLMPGIDRSALPEDHCLQFVSHERVCKEAVLWSGLHAHPRCWASVHTPAGWVEIGANGLPTPLGELAAPCTLYEPDPAVIRAGAISELCMQLNGWLFDGQIAYILAADVQPTPFAQTFRIHEVHRFGLKLLNRRLAGLGIGRVELKRRGFPTEPEELRSRLRLAQGDKAGVVIFTRRGHEHFMLIGERLTDESHL